MALETLKGVKEIGGYKVAEFDKNGDFNCKLNEIDKYFVVIRQRNNIIEFKIQNGPIKENGVNGCQVDTIIETAKKMYEGFQKDFAPCEETAQMIKHCQAIIDLTAKRKADREKRGVEGYSKK